MEKKMKEINHKKKTYFIKKTYKIKSTYGYVGSKGIEIYRDDLSLVGKFNNISEFKKYY